jgi:hypothetical protein
MNSQVIKTGSVGYITYLASIAHQITAGELELLTSLEQWPQEFRLMCSSALHYEQRSCSR